ncbi:MAG: hypothetical protein MZU97_11600 [Bacillus subtilis]|nr:hypothetical protein [Bacillus subtilis]
MIDPLAALGFPRVTLDHEHTFKARNGAFLPETIFSEKPKPSSATNQRNRLRFTNSTAARGAMRLAVML